MEHDTSDAQSAQPADAYLQAAADALTSARVRWGEDRDFLMQISDAFIDLAEVVSTSTPNSQFVTEAAEQLASAARIARELPGRAKSDLLYGRQLVRIARVSGLGKSTGTSGRRWFSRRVTQR